MTNSSPKVIVKPYIDPEMVKICREQQCPNLSEVFGVPPYCRLVLLRLCGFHIIKGGCGIPIAIEQSQDKDEAARASFFTSAVEI